MPIEYKSVTDLAIGLGRIPGELRRELRPRLQASADHIITDMRGRASYSSRIPGAIRTGAAFGARTGGVTIRVDHKAAPHARPLEGLTSRGGMFRHPVFGNRSNWVSQPTRPFFFPAVKAGRAQLSSNVAEAVQAAQRKVIS